MRDPLNYLIVDTHGYMKIGMSQRPEERLLGLQTATYSVLKLRKVWLPPKGVPAVKVESMLHKHFSAYRVRGEWFRPIPVQEISDVITTYGAVETSVAEVAAAEAAYLAAAKAALARRVAAKAKREAAAKVKWEAAAKAKWEAGAPARRAAAKAKRAAAEVAFRSFYPPINKQAQRDVVNMIGN